MKQLRSGMRLKSAVCSTELIVVRAPATAIDLRCGGQAILDMIENGESAGGPEADSGEGCQAGSHYVNEDGSLELMCIRSGAGSLSIAGTLLRSRQV